MTLEARQGYAEQLVGNPLLDEICTKMEREATEKSINACPSDDEARRVAMYQVRAIRKFQRELKTLAGGKTNPKKKQVIA